MSMQQFRRAYEYPIRTHKGAKRLWVIRPDPRFRNMSPAQLGDFYDAERGVTKKGVKR